MTVPYEKIFNWPHPLTSPIEQDGQLYLLAKNGEILKFKDGQSKTEFNFASELSSIVIDKTNKCAYLADMAHQSIMRRAVVDNQEQITDFLKDYEGQPLIGPNSMIMSEVNQMLFFSDSGPFGETSIENSKGSLYAIDLEQRIVKPLALACLSYPSGIALSNDHKILYLCETGKNRVLRFVQTNAGIYYSSVYYQFNGRFGPIAVAVSQSEHLYVARYEFQQVSEEGIIAIINKQGQLVESIALPQCTEIVGMCFSSLKSNILYVTESNQCLRILVQLEDKEEGKKKDSIMKFK